MYPCGTYVRKMYSTFSVFEVKMTLTVYGSGLELLSVRVTALTTINHINLLRNIIHNK